MLLFVSANGDAPPTGEIVERLLATDNLPDQLRGIRRRIQEYAGGRKETRFEIWERLPVKFRSEVLSAETVREFDFEVVSAPSGMLDAEADVVIQNKSGLIEYNSETNRYYKREFEPPEEEAGHTTNPTLVGSSPTTNFDVTYDGMDTVAGRETHVLTFRPAEDADFPFRESRYITLWVDGEYWFPLGREVVHEIRDEGLLQPNTDEDLQDETYFQTNVFEEITFDLAVEDGVSRFDSPRDAERIE